ncbi:MAG TPA: SLC13 family permease [Bellilinea sp.]|nr:SLC13 family permease [Bellilinea sp.]
MEFIQANLDVISLIALIVAIVISIWRNVNLGIIALGIAYVIGTLLGGQTVKDLVKGFPTDLFLILVGVTFFFGIAQTNGTLEKFTKLTIKSVRGNVALLPIVLFFVAFIISSVGAGQISSAALLALPVMALAVETKINPLLMAIVVGNGCMAGVMSPLCPTGLIAQKIMAEMGVPGDHRVSLWLHVAAAFFISSVLAYIFLGGLKLWKNRKAVTAESEALQNIKVEAFDSKQKATIVATLLLLVAVIFFKWDIGFVGMILGAILLLFNVANEKEVFKAVPWSAIILVTGVTVLVKLMQNVGGMDLFAQIIGAVSTPFTATLVVGFVAALVSAYASTSGVILPAFLPMVPLLIANIGAPESMLIPLVYTVIVAGHLTDMSPLSTTGAIFVAGAPVSVDRKPLYNGLLVYGLAMSVIGAVMVWLFYTVFRVLG